MTYSEYRATLKYELCRLNWENPSWLQWLRMKYLQPNTNCMYLARKMWYLHEKGKIGRLLAKCLYLRIHRKYGCTIYPNAQVGKGFFISHPVGIVLGKCEIGEDFMIYHQCTIGVRQYGDEAHGATPVIGDHVKMYTGSMILGKVCVTDRVVIGASSIVLNDITEPGTYAGIPAKKCD